MDKQQEKLSWGWLVRNTAVAIGFTFVVVAGLYLAVRLLMTVAALL